MRPIAQDVFISYSRDDPAFVERLNAFLTGVGVTTWFDRTSLRPGQKWERRDRRTRRVTWRCDTARSEIPSLLGPTWRVPAGGMN
ncbi:MAG: hypothetical protein DMD96_34285 [Candidatus Rokuibacteriota bacterium]|nr:MAG: hypothetical protein DMD96_34285 [Candidatus Rokubacteria bacterium]